ncbi:hypothetical protein BKA63DRAFT_516579 [Paraphoma chrysanthemicola]|nr:hypothetical protein BKA63DRAFT_516579 [Paraphoma chrysanthemicola]
MPHPCPICPSSFPTKARLTQHIGTKKLSAATRHTCPKCTKTFCRLDSMESHRDAPAHAYMFKCKHCPQRFGAKRDVAQHEETKVHARSSGKKLKEKARVGGVGGENVVGGGVGVAGVLEKKRGDAGDGYIAFDYDDNDSAAHSDNNSDGRIGASSSSPPYRRAVQAYYPGLDDDQDWVLCDKDCGWCGHCGDGVDFDD